jgi:hypothetical protein
MKFFTIDTIILLCLLAIIGLAFIVSHNRTSEGYINKNTVYADYLQKIEPVVRQINYFNGKESKLVNKNTGIDCFNKNNIIRPEECFWTYHNITSPTSTKKVFTGKKIGDERANYLMTRLTESKIVIERLKQTDAVIQADIDNVLKDLRVIVDSASGSIGTYDAEIKTLPVEITVPNTDKIRLLEYIAFFSKIGDISAEKTAELYTMIWATKSDTITANKNENTNTYAAIQSAVENLKIPNYELKIKILDEIEYFRNTDDLSELKVSDIYKELYKDHSVIGLNNIFNKYLKTIPDYENKKPKPFSKKLYEDTSYNTNVPNVTYHEDPEYIRSRDKTMINVKDASGNIVSLPWNEAATTTPRYNDESYYRFSPSPYVPNYEDSVYLSQLTKYNDDEKNTQVNDYASGLPPPVTGFCTANKNSTIELETQCNKIGKDACASTSCCVLLGGSKCVTGDNSGPTMKSNYSDISVLNRDYYYYQGKCYGNCP